MCHDNIFMYLQTLRLIFRDYQTYINQSIKLRIRNMCVRVYVYVFIVFCLFNPQSLSYPLSLFLLNVYFVIYEVLMCELNKDNFRLNFPIKQCSQPLSIFMISRTNYITTLCISFLLWKLHVPNFKGVSYD